MANDSEWTLKRIFIRLIMYALCTLMIVGGVYMILEPLTSKSVWAGYGLISIAISYITIDIRVILAARREKREIYRGPR